jgi:hypothetical protein
MKQYYLIILFLLLLLLGYGIIYFLNANSVDQEKEMTTCGSTLPIKCYTYRCENGYIVRDGTETMPGGGSRSKMCSDGTLATETIVE